MTEILPFELLQVIVDENDNIEWIEVSRLFIELCLDQIRRTVQIISERLMSKSVDQETLDARNRKTNRPATHNHGRGLGEFLFTFLHGRTKLLFDDESGGLLRTIERFENIDPKRIIELIRHSPLSI